MPTPTPNDPSGGASIPAWIKTPLAVSILGGLVVMLIWQLFWVRSDKQKEIRAKMNVAERLLERGDTTEAVQAYDVILQIPEAESRRSVIELQQGRCYVLDADNGKSPVANLRKAAMYFERARSSIARGNLSHTVAIEGELVEVYLRIASWRETSTYLAKAGSVLKKLSEHNAVLHDRTLALAIAVAQTDHDLQHARLIGRLGVERAANAVQEAIRRAEAVLRTGDASSDRRAQARLHTLLSFGYRQLSDLQRSQRRSRCERAMTHAREARRGISSDSDTVLFARAIREEGSAYYCLATVFNPPGNLYEAISLYTESTRLFEDAHRLEEVAKTQHNLAAAYALLGEFDRPEVNLDVASQHASRAAAFLTWDYSALATEVAINRAVIALVRAEHFQSLEDAEIASAELQRILRSEPDASKKAIASTLSGACRLRLGVLRGDRRELLAAIDELQRSLPPQTDPSYAMIRASVGEAYLALADLENEQTNLSLAIFNLTDAFNSQPPTERPYAFCNAATLLATAMARHSILTEDAGEFTRSLEFAAIAANLAKTYQFHGIQERIQPLITGPLASVPG